MGRAQPKAIPPSRTSLLRAVRERRAADVAASLRAATELRSYRDERGRSLLHVCCGVNVAERKLAPRDAVRTADALLDHLLKRSGTPEQIALLLRRGARRGLASNDGETAQALLVRQRDPRLRRPAAAAAPAAP